MTRPKLTIIKGGLSSAINDRPKHFVTAYVTNTRLMGVLAVYARWFVTPLAEEAADGFDGDLHQFFYIDCEEAGLETYTSHHGNNAAEIEATEHALVGGLGAQKMEINEHMLRGLLCKYKRFNEENGLPLPKGLDEYGFILEEDTALEVHEQKKLMELICVDITSDYQAVNYFLMRVFGRDYEGARYLTAAINLDNYSIDFAGKRADGRMPNGLDADGSTEHPITAGLPRNDFPLDLYDRYVRATFCRNVIDVERRYGDGSVSYLCESLIEMNGNYDSIISKVVVKDLNVIGFEHCNGFRISSAEAAMMLAKPEFCTVFEVLLSDEEVENNIGEFTVGLRTIMSTHPNGRMFMSFKKNNDHVDNRVFMLSNDVNGVYYLTDFGQLITAAYSLEDIQKLESTLAFSPLAPYLVTTAKYEFKEPVLFEFVNSNFEDFDDFLSFINGD